jgi:carbonic anhydrase
MTRSLALACAVKGAKEIAIIGHTDCLVAKTSMIQLLERFRALGIERHLLPDNLNEYFGLFSSERQNVIKGADIVRQSPLIGPKIAVHGLLVDINNGKLEWLVNGYQTFQTLSSRWHDAAHSAAQTVDAFKSLSDFQIGEMKFPETKIGEIVTKAEDWLSEKLHKIENATEKPAEAAPATPPKLPLPPRVRARVRR